MIKLSIIVPVYNVEKYIDKCLETLVNQTLEELEIIIVNDGSQDNSKKIIEKYVKQYPTKIKYYEKKNEGLSSARNYGLKYATGEYVAFLDADDYVEKNMYEEMYRLAKKENSDMVECDFIREWDYGKKVYDRRRNYHFQKKRTNKCKYLQANGVLTKDKQMDKYKKEMIKIPRVVAWNKIYKNDILNKTLIRFPESLIYEDLEFFCELLPYLNKISYINKYFVHYVQREDSISNSQTEKTGDIFKILDNIFSFYKEKNLYNKYEKALKYMSKRILLGSSLKRILKIKDTQVKRKMILKTVINFLKYSGWSSNESRKVTKETTISGQIYSKETYDFSDSIKKKKKICFGITKLGIGGAERVLVDVINELSSQYSITMFSIYGGGEFEKELNSKIKIVRLFAKERKSKVIPICILICGKLIYNRFLKKKYDVEIAFLEGPITRIFSYKGNSEKIAWVHNDISKVFGNNKKAQIKQHIDKWFYKKYDKIVFVSEQNKKVFENVYGNISERKVIYNYIDKERVLRLSEDKIHENNNRDGASNATDIMKKCNEVKKNIVIVSRLVKQKAIDRIIRVHKKLIDENLKHKIYVIGEGEQEEYLTQMAKELQVNDSIIFLGKKENPYPYIKEGDFFALLSYFEGYGIVIEEAKILNKPLLLTNTAAIEAVKDYDRKLVIQNDEEAIFEELKKVLIGEYDFLWQKEQDFKYDNGYLIEQIKEILRVISLKDKKKMIIWYKSFKRSKKGMKFVMKLSILTATYNRAKCLEKLYNSIIKNITDNDKLKNNTLINNYLEIEWIIVDDGSTDETKNVVEQFITENNIANKINNNMKNKINYKKTNSMIDIKYFYQQNSGKMAAINKAVEYATGELIVDCDSDDFFSDGAFKIIQRNSYKLLENNDLYAICFLKKDLFGNISGKVFPTNYMKSTMFELYFRYNIEGEKILVFKAKVRKKFKHELEKGEKFVTEARMYHKMDEKYKILCINEAIEIGDYREDGYTKNIMETFRKYPSGYYKYFKEILQKGLKGVLLKKKMYVLKHFVMFWIFKKCKKL